MHDLSKITESAELAKQADGGWKLELGEALSVYDLAQVFTEDSDGVGIEKIVTKGGDSLVVLHSGCEYYNFDYQILTKSLTFKTFVHLLKESGVDDFKVDRLQGF